MLEKFLNATQFIAILAVCSLGALAMYKITEPAAAKEIVVLAITSMGSLASGGAIGYAAGRIATKKEDKDKIKP